MIRMFSSQVCILLLTPAVNYGMLMFAPLLQTFGFIATRRVAILKADVRGASFYPFTSRNYH